MAKPPRLRIQNRKTDAVAERATGRSLVAKPTYPGGIPLRRIDEYVRNGLRQLS